MVTRSVALLIGLLAACDESERPSDAGGDPHDVTVSPVWPRDLPSAADVTVATGERVVRAIIHAHSPVSWDACDERGFADGGVVQGPCVEHLRRAICANRVDVLFLTDHSEHVADLGYRDLFNAQRGDEFVRDGAGAESALRITCPDGHRALVAVGNEDALMTLGLRRHVIQADDREMRRTAYNADGPTAATSFRDAGALVVVPHTESRELDYLTMLEPDGIEIYNLHASFDPTIRMRWLGLDPFSHLGGVTEFLAPQGALDPDLGTLAFFTEQVVSLDKWAALEEAGVHVLAVAGNDAHENTFANPARDGERGDGYRRLMRWFSNHVLIPASVPVDLDTVTTALRRHTSYVAFEAYGTPIGFSFHATDAGGTLIARGARVPPGSTLVVTRPSLPPGFPNTPAPTIEVRLHRAEGGRWRLVERTGEDRLSFRADQAGVYRADATIVPEHARPYLGARGDQYVREVIWTYSNALAVE